MSKGFIAVHPAAIIDNDPVSEAFKTEWAQYNNNSPDPDAAFAYDTVLLAAQALQKGIALKGSDLDQALHNSSFNGVTGYRSFDIDGNVTLALYDLWQVKDSSWQVIRRWLVD